MKIKLYSEFRPLLRAEINHWFPTQVSYILLTGGKALQRQKQAHTQQLFYGIARPLAF